MSLSDTTRKFNQRATGSPQWMHMPPAWVWVALVLLAVLMGLWWVSIPRSLEGAFYIQKSRFETVEPAGEAPKNVVLPHIWDDENPPISGLARYTLSIQTPELWTAPKELGLYLSRVGARFRVLLNGQIIASEHWSTPGYVDTSVVPYWIALPPALLKTPLASNELMIEVQGQKLRKSGLTPVMIGSAQALLERYERVMLWQVQATWMVAACSFLLALLCGLIWWNNREKTFGYLAAASLMWGVRLSLSPGVHQPVSFEVWFYLHKLSFTFYCGFLYLFLHELFSWQQDVIKRLIFAMMWIAPLWLGAIVVSENYNLYRIWTALITGIAVVSLSMMFYHSRWGLDQSQRLMVIVGIVTMITGVRDFLVVQLGFAGDGDIRWMTLGSLVFMLTLAWILVQRTQQYMHTIDSLNQNLERRVVEKEAELRQAFESLRLAEHRQVLEAERSRLTRDMHDGLGSQLVQTLNLVRAQGATPAQPAAHNEQVAGMISRALEELRMTLDSLEPLEGDLPAILGTLRQRMTPALLAAGIELDWRVEEVCAVQVHGKAMDSSAVMHLFRALQEIFANILKHAKAHTVIVKTWDEPGQVVLSVCDDGIGIGSGFRTGGRGMQNLQARADALDAQLIVSVPARANGTCVELRFNALEASL